jgi:hypothetical protein
VKCENKLKRIEDPDETTQIHPPHFYKGTKNIHWRRQALQQMLLKKVVICLKKTETRPMPMT